MRGVRQKKRVLFARSLTHSLKCLSAVFTSRNRRHRSNSRVTRKLRSESEGERKEVKRSDQKYSSQLRNNAHQEEFTVISLMLPCSLPLPRLPSLLIVSVCPGRARRRISSFHSPSDRVESAIRTFVTSIGLLRISSSFFVILLLPMLAKFTAMPLRLLHRLQFLI